MIGAGSRAPREWHFLQLTLLMAAWMLLTPHLKDRWLVQAVLQLFVLNSVLVVLWVNPEWRRARTILIGLWLVSLASSLIGMAPLPERLARLALHAETATLVLVLALTATGMLRFVYRARRFTSDSVFATVAVYLLIALLFARLYLWLIAGNPHSFDLPVPAAERTQQLLHIDLFYYSLITQASVGYGDILPVSETARMLAVMQAIVGQFYMAVVVAVFVGMYAAHRQAE